MTDAELAAIKARVLRFEPAIDLRATDAAIYVKLSAMTFDARTLLAEVERLKAREAASITLARYILAGYVDPEDHTFYYRQLGMDIDEVIAQARALLGDEVTP